MMTTKIALTTCDCLFAGNESWMDLNLQLSTRSPDKVRCLAYNPRRFRLDAPVSRT
jgi:hypothetical protein